MPKISFPSFNCRMIAMLIFVVSFGLQASGCLLLLGVGAGAGGTAYVMGKLEAEIDVSVPKLQKATVVGLRALSMPVIKERGDKLTAEVESKTADDATVKISLSSLTPSRSTISIRVGLIGNETRSRQILDAIRKHI